MALTCLNYIFSNKGQMDHRTDCWIQWTNLTVSYMDRIVARSDQFHCCIIVCTIESIPVDCNHYF